MIQCFVRKAKDSNRLDVVRYLRKITPAGTTGKAVKLVWFVSVRLHVRYCPLFYHRTSDCRSASDSLCLSRLQQELTSLLQLNPRTNIAPMNNIFLFSKGPLLPEQLNVQDIPVSMRKELTIDLSGKYYTLCNTGLCISAYK